MKRKTKKVGLWVFLAAVFAGGFIPLINDPDAPGDNEADNKVGLWTYLIDLVKINM